jgi:hypothetical protein
MDKGGPAVFGLIFWPSNLLRWIIRCFFLLMGVLCLIHTGQIISTVLDAQTLSELLIGIISIRIGISKQRITQPTPPTKKK